MRRHTDSRRTGYFALFPSEVVEVNVAVIEPGASAGDWHGHQFQDDYWWILDGGLWAVTKSGAADLDTECGPTHSVRLTNASPPLLIITGTWHTYKNPHDVPATLIYGLTNQYNPRNPDEHRLAFTAEEAKLYG